nr:hypothetical protein Itr_chr15CG07450 [Ipomoea trifida]
MENYGDLDLGVYKAFRGGLRNQKQHLRSCVSFLLDGVGLGSLPRLDGSETVKYVINTVLGHPSAHRPLLGWDKVSSACYFLGAGFEDD